MRISERLKSTCRQTQEWTAWLDQLPQAVSELLERWSLTLGTAFEENATCSWVASVTWMQDIPAVLKLCLPHMEGRDEAQGLRFWNGDPTVRLFAADVDKGAMLLERCEPGTSLRQRSEPEQTKIIAALLRRLWRKPIAPHCFRPLSALTEYWSAETSNDAGKWTDAGLVREGLDLFAELPRTTPGEVLLATDLHAGNILAAQREPWLMIDPKPFVGDPAYDLTQHLFNCPVRLLADPHGTIRRFAEAADVDEERVRLWTFARAAAEPRGDWGDGRLTAIARALKP